MQVQEQEFDGREFIWTRANTTTSIRQMDGIDLVIEQTTASKKRVFHSYSEPGLHLFAALLNYHHITFGELPNFNEIQHVQGTGMQYQQTGLQVDIEELVDKATKLKLPEPKDGKVIYQTKETFVGGGHSSSFYAYIDQGSFIIASKTSDDSPVTLYYLDEDHPISSTTEPISYGREIILKPDDALRVMKVIFYLTNCKHELEEVYNRSRETLEQHNSV